MDSNIRDNLSQSSLDQYFTDNPQEIQKQIDGLYEADVKGTISPLKEELTEGASKIGSVFREQVTKTELPEHSGSSQPSVSISREQAVTTKIIVAAEAILNKQNKSLLDQAIATGDAAKLQYLIKNGVSINRVYHDGETPLTAAIKNHDAHAITFLLSQGASLDVYNSDCYVPVMIAGVYFPQSLPIFIQAGVDVTSGPFPLLNVIIQLNHKEGFAELEKRQFDFSVKDKSGKNIVLYSVSKEEQALHFLEAKGLLRKLDKAEKTQLFFHFLRRGFHEAAVSVLKSGIDFSAVDPRTKSSVFMSAVEAKNETAAKLIANSPEFDPAEIHKLQNNFVLELKYAGDLNETALSYLLAAGVDPGIPDPCGITLFDYCLWRSSPASEPRFDVGLAEKLVANMKDPLTYIQNLPLSATDKTAILQAVKNDPRALAKPENCLLIQNCFDRILSNRVLSLSMEPVNPEILEACKKLRDESSGMAGDLAYLLTSEPETVQNLQSARISVSNTMRSEGSLASTQQWLDGERRVREMALSKKPLTKEILCELNREINPKQGGEIRQDGQEIQTWSRRQLYLNYLPGNVAEKELDHLLTWMNEAIVECEKGKMEPIVLATNVYQRMVSIHPFFDGNGRTTRYAMDYILQRFGLPPAALPDANVAIFSLEEKNVSSSEAVKIVLAGVENSYQYLAPLQRRKGA